MKDIPDNTKRVKVFEKIFVGLGKNKIFFKDLQKPQDHFTMLFTKDGRLDFHETQEGSEKNYKSLGEFDLLGLVKQVAYDPHAEEKFVKELFRNAKKVNFEEPEFANYIIIDMGIKDEMLKHAKKTKRRVEIPAEPFEKSGIEKFTINWKEAKNQNIIYGSVMNGDDLAGLLLKFKDDSYFLPISALLQTTIGKLVENMKEITDSRDSQRQKASNI